MSRILRRPLFRGGPASSDNVGIASGLNNPRQGYADGPDDQGVQSYDESGSSIVNAQNPYYSVTPSKMDQIRYNYKKAIEDKFFKQPETLTTEPKQEIKNKNIQPTMAQDIDTYTKLLMNNAGADKDEYTRQKYLTLAKFGLNLLKPTPVGIKPSLATSIASAAEKPLEEYGNISMQQSKDDRALKQAGVQMAIQQHMPGNTGKAIDDLMRRGYSMEQATNLVFKNDAAAQRKEDLTEMAFHATNLQARFPVLAKQEFAGQSATAAKSYLAWEKKHRPINYGTIKSITETNRKDGDFVIDPRTGIIGLQKNGKLLTPDEV